MGQAPRTSAPPPPLCLKPLTGVPRLSHRLFTSYSRFTHRGVSVLVHNLANGRSPPAPHRIPSRGTPILQALQPPPPFGTSGKRAISRRTSAQSLLRRCYLAQGTRRVRSHLFTGCQQAEFSIQTHRKQHGRKDHGKQRVKTQRFTVSFKFLVQRLLNA